MDQLEVADRVPRFEEAETHESEDFGIDDGVLILLTNRIRVEHTDRKGTTVKEMNKLIDETLCGYSYEEFGNKPVGNPDVVEPIRRIVVFADDITVTRGPKQEEVDTEKGWRPSNGRAGEYGRLHQRARRPEKTPDREWI